MSEVATLERSSPQAVTGANPMAMIENAVMGGADVAIIEKLMELQERWQKNQGRTEFSRAMSSAKAEIGPILKTRKVDFTSAKGRTNYDYEDLGQIAKQIDPILAKYGLSYRFRTEVSDATIIVTCIVEHRDGHNEETSLPGQADNSGNKNSIQAVGSTVTYLQRYTLKAALGLAAAKDDDAKAAGDTTRDPQVTPEQADALRKLMLSRGKSEPDFLAFLALQKINAESLSDLTLSQAKTAKAILASHKKVEAEQ